VIIKSFDEINKNIDLKQNVNNKIRRDVISDEAILQRVVMNYPYMILWIVLLCDSMYESPRNKTKSIFEYQKECLMNKL
jgi:hypothetical protein